MKYDPFEIWSESKTKTNLNYRMQIGNQWKSLKSNENFLTAVSPYDNTSTEHIFSEFSETDIAEVKKSCYAPIR